MTAVTLIDYGAGNLRSLRAAFERLGCAVLVSGDADQVAAADRLVLPGVGAAAPAMAALRERGLDQAIAASQAPLLGVCLGMQLLFEHSDEGDVDCLGLLAGNVIAIDWAERVPHMGWNDVVGDGPPAICYFAHSFAVDCDDRLVAARTAIDGRQVPTVVRSGRLSGVQFHPEKSASDGRGVLERWLAA
jgi:imidazole glycerol-phosphate synthase subunit HisH